MKRERQSRTREAESSRADKERYVVAVTALADLLMKAPEWLATHDRLMATTGLGSLLVDAYAARSLGSTDALQKLVNDYVLLVETKSAAIFETWVEFAGLMGLGVLGGPELRLRLAALSEIALRNAMRQAVGLDAKALRVKAYIPTDTAKRYQTPSRETIATHVEWLYRSRIKKPPDTITALAKRFGRERKSIRDGIEGAHSILTKIRYPEAVEWKWDRVSPSAS